ncbi:hypothetical protein Alches_16200 [Alicyclobacillus hesperidum subsp. aegles]|uniref:glycoside hydrolase domain-containing protein n=1 Tax=Alicyclobacillus hesperidum TaxID=89784 RepID=UPI00222B3103|nr:glycoside hydrolase domain-containing protein [Alicyclobacillus hesperidum]GLG01580.1 hypothetical protein Alches_16200 [Alicyclobacillus hesperidum subsp. aegles]
MTQPIMQVVDGATPLTATSAAAIKAAGYGGAMRYLGNWSKSITKAEAQSILAAGLSLGLIWEGDPTYAGYFTPSQAVTDAQAAVASAQNIGAPAGTGIAFTVDYDAAQADMSAIVAYFAVIIAKCSPYRPGAYGGASVLDALYQAYGDKLWYWQTSAWSNGQQFTNNAMYQNTYDMVVGGVQVDVSDVYADPGFWHPATTPSNQPQPVPSGGGDNVTTTILQEGSTGDAVKALQQDLNKVLGLNIAVDGIYGPQTAAAVKSFQLQHGLTVDGIYGQQTAAAMAQALGALDSVTVDKAKLQAVVNELQTVLDSAKALL